MSVLALNTVKPCIVILALLVTTHGQVQGDTYVVDSSASGAADTNAGTEEKPFKTVQQAADVAKPGDTIYVMAGKYDERVKVKAGGTEGKPVAFLATPWHSVTVGGFDLVGSYVRVEGFEITADKPATAVQLSASHCEILDNFIHHMKAAVSGTVGKASADGNTRNYSAVAHNRIAYNKVYHCEYGFILGGEDWLVENNEVSRLFMYSSGKPYYDCDYSRFFGKRCIQRGAGRDGVTIGALEYPNVYYVDPRHPAATDEPAWGYPGVPLASLAKACAIAQPGETIVLRGGVYREVLAPKHDRVTVRVMQGEQVTISGADLITGWNRETDESWSAALPDEPKQVLRDGRPWSDFSYDKSALRITVKSGGDPRLHVFETIQRRQGVDLIGTKNAQIEGIEVVDLRKADTASPRSDYFLTCHIPTNLASEVRQEFAIRLKSASCSSLRSP